MKKTFIGRENDLKFLNSCYTGIKTQACLLILSGKIRVGKTRLLKTFFQKKPHIYYHITKGSFKDQLETTLNLFIKEFEDYNFDKTIVVSWLDFFKYLGEKLVKQKVTLTIVFDEFQNLAETQPAIVEDFVKGWKKYLKNKKLFLILSGSSLGLMNKYVLYKNSPLLHKDFHQHQLENFNFENTKNCFSDGSFEKIFSLYSIVGGVPAYLQALDSHKSLRQNIAQKVISKTSFLSTEPQLLINEEFQDPKIYLTILKSIGFLDLSFSQIVTKTGLKSNILIAYLDQLIKKKILQKTLSFSDKLKANNKNGLYSISDYFLRFYFSFIFPNYSLIETDQLDILFKKESINLNKLFAKAYEETSLEFLKAELGLECQFSPWWNKESRISWAGIDLNKKQIIFADCYWKNRLIGVKELNLLKNKAAQVPLENQYITKTFCLISKEGFTDELIKLLNSESLILIEKDRVI